jgi:hypothetical protein
VFVWEQLHVATIKSKTAANALVLAGPDYDGETCWHQLEINNKVAAVPLEAELREELRVFAPLAREDPMAMIHRFDILLHDYRCQDLENADHWNPEKKIRFALELFHPSLGRATSLSGYNAL